MPPRRAQTTPPLNVSASRRVWTRSAATAEAGQSKALLRLLINDLRVNGRSEILPTYRIITPEVCAMSEEVEAAGIEPAFSGARRRIRSGTGFVAENG
jgi:hypothetical protein